MTPEEELEHLRAENAELRRRLDGPKMYDWGEIRRLRAEGLLYKQIAARMGCSIQTVKYTLNPNYREKAKARRRVKYE